MMQKQIVILLSLISIVYGYSEDSTCERYENKIYQYNFTFPGGRTFYSVARFLPNGQLDEISSIEGGNEIPELGASYQFSNGIGRYKCLPRNHVRVTVIIYDFKTESVPFLNVTGGTGVIDVYLRFYKNYESCKGSLINTVFPAGTNPFTKKVQPVFQSPVGTASCELLHFRPYYDLSSV